MTTPRDMLGDVSGGRVLDVATGSGGFIHFLLEGLKDYTGIVGIDTNERGAEAFAQAFKEKPNVRFQKMDAARLDFEDASFDMACLSNSLHHLDPEPVFREMMRVLRPGGTLVVAEMYRDHQAGTQMTHVELHHWWAAVDTVNGIVHRETHPRAEIVEMVNRLGLRALRTYDLSDLGGNPKDPEILNELNPVIDRTIQRAEGHPDLQARGEQLRKRVAEIGFHSATSLVIVGEKMDVK